MGPSLLDLCSSMVYFFGIQGLFLTEQIQWYNDTVTHFRVVLVFGYVKSWFYYYPAVLYGKVINLRQR
jgi:hypothetical protein